MAKKEFTLSMLEEALDNSNFKETVESMGNGYYRIAKTVIGGESFLQEIDDAIKDEVSGIVIDVIK